MKLSARHSCRTSSTRWQSLRLSAARSAATSLFPAVIVSLTRAFVGQKALPQITRSSVTGVCVTGIMRIVLFLAALGVISQGFQLDPSNPPASVFQLAVGNVGYKIFGVVMWAAAISSVIGAAYTSVSFYPQFQSDDRK